MPDVPAAAAAALTFAVDYPVFDPLLYPRDTSWVELTSGASVYGSSIDHALWFHRLVRFTDWLLLDQVAPIGAGPRGFARGELRTPDGALVASVAQEVSFLPVRR